MTEIQDRPLAGRWQDLLRDNPKLRIRDAATELGVSEAELLATRCGDGVTRLEGDWPGVIRRLPALGPVLCLTRNEAAVHERHGRFRQIEFFHGMGQVVGPDIDLRLFLDHWCHGFAVVDATPGGDRRSLQFFDATGTATHKVFLTESSDRAAYDAIVNDYRSADQSTAQDVLPVVGDDPEREDAAIDVEGFQAAWLALEDTHGFFPMLRKFHVGREQALRLAPAGHATPMPGDTIRQVLDAASRRSLEIMVFVGSRGCIQIHTGPVTNIKPLGDEWLNVLDEEFNLHLRMPRVARSWIVRKPTRDGLVTSLELYDPHGHNIALLFGKRKPGQPESAGWRSLLDELAGGGIA